MSRLVVVLAIAALWPLAHAYGQAAPEMFPFVVPWDDGSKGTATDLSYLNDCPAGANGYIVVKNGHFAESKTGRRIRFLGTNFCFSATMPSHADADGVATHLAKLGVNIVRFMSEDVNSPGWSLWAKSDPRHTKLDPAAMDRLDYLVAALKRKGVFVDLGLHVDREFVPANGFPDSIRDLSPEFNNRLQPYDKRIDNVDRRMIDLQKQYAKDFLTHVNPYTGMTFAVDPCVAIVEINNEDSLVWTNDTAVYCDALPDPFRQEMSVVWNGWLTKKYHANANMLAAWFPPATNGTDQAELLGASSHWDFYDATKAATLKQTANSSPTSPADIDVDCPVVPVEAWHVQSGVCGLDLVEGKNYTLTFRAKARAPRTMEVFASADTGDWHKIGLQVFPRIQADWKQYRFTFAATKVIARHSRIAFVFGNVAGAVSVADIRLSVASAATALDPGISLESQNIPFPLSAGRAEAADWARFAAETEAGYAEEMCNYLRRDLHVHANLVDTQAGIFGEISTFNREAGSDFIDNHDYWQHPAFPHKSWDQVDWKISNTPMVDALAKGEAVTLTKMAQYKVADKPYTVTEYNHPAPSDYQAEMFPEYATFGAFQDWDAIFEFCFGGYGHGAANDAIQDYFSTNGNPAKEAFLPCSALIFRSGLFAAAPRVATLELPSSAPFSGGTAYEAWRLALDGSMPESLTTRLQTRIDSAVNTSRVAFESRRAAAGAQINVVKTPSGAVYEAVSDRAATAAGYLGGQTIKLGDVSITCPTFGNNFAAMMLTPLDGKPLRQSRRLLLAIIGKAENIGMVWNDTRTSVGRNWGHGPVQAEGIPAMLALANPHIRHVWALDPTGARANELRVTTSGRFAKVTVGPEDKTVWYELAK